MPHASHASDPSTHPCPQAAPTIPQRKRCRIAFILLLTLLTSQASIAVEVQQGTCPARWENLNKTNAPGEETAPCYTADLPGPGWWRIEVMVRVDHPTRGWARRAHLLEARFELLLAIDQAGTYRLCPGMLPVGATVAPVSAFLPFGKEGDPKEIEIDPDLQTAGLKAEPAPRIVALVPCGLPSKEGDLDEIEIDSDL